MDEKEVPCEVCGEPAVGGVRDYCEKPAIGCYREFEPVGPPHCLCKAHLRDPVQYGVSSLATVSEALREFNRALELDPTNADILREMKEAHAGMR